MKKIFCLLLCFSLLLTFFIIPASAAIPQNVPTIDNEVTIEGVRTQFIIYGGNSGGIVNDTTVYLVVFHRFEPVYGKKYAVTDGKMTAFVQSPTSTVFSASASFVDENDMLGYSKYELVNGSWEFVDNVNTFSSLYGIKEFYYSSLDVYTFSNGAVFFLKTPLPFSLQTVEGSLIQMKNQTAGNLMTLTVCGVGLVALLVLLYLLPKILHKYLH